jgi:Xaa-Pro dipeptidase
MMDIPLDVFAERARKAREIMAEVGVDAMQLTGRENYHYLSGDVRNVARMLLPLEADPILIVFYTEAEFARQRTWVQDIRGWSTPAELMKTFLGALKDLGLKDKVVGFDVHTVPAFLLHKFETLNPNIKLVENEEVTMRLRYYKDDYELERMREAARVADIGLKAGLEAVRTGVTESQVAAAAEGAMRNEGAERFGASTFVDSGPNSMCLHGAASTRKIQEGEVVIVDVHPVVAQYSCDVARTTVCGEPTVQQKRALKTYVDAQGETLARLKPGMKVGDITKTFVEIVSAMPYGAAFVPGATHGVGLEFEEWPHPSHYPQHLGLELKPRMTLTLGHSLMPVEELGEGFRVEDVMLITETGAEYLTATPRYPW